ncbi:DUF3148 domain-containing protein [Oscillatoria sp. CS-180]|uniref:regulatory protein SipA n=1 Tax=Oscillatoria sp. CS-180 TaxID=3021720 RepID=UPI00232CC3D9|nr:DUF3148 domain-containing protein [Oscillatoria sp. CS-180]MDB9529847.1 DUF3148 domain-containing protein [Oscillatoria sp. CS-180]
MSAAFIIGDRVRLASQPPYFKTADTMPMLRPGDLIPVGAEGIVMEQKPSSYWTIKFEQGSFLVDIAYLERVPFETDS